MGKFSRLKALLQADAGFNGLDDAATVARLEAAKSDGKRTQLTELYHIISKSLDLIEAEAAGGSRPAKQLLNLFRTSVVPDVDLNDPDVVTALTAVRTAGALTNEQVNALVALRDSSSIGKENALDGVTTAQVAAVRDDLAAANEDDRKDRAAVREVVDEGAAAWEARLRAEHTARPGRARHRAIIERLDDATNNNPAATAFWAAVRARDAALSGS